MGSDVRDIHLGGEGLDRRGFALRILLVKDGAGLRIYVNRIFLILPDFHISTGIGLRYRLVRFRRGNRSLTLLWVPVAGGHKKRQGNQGEWK